MNECCSTRRASAVRCVPHVLALAVTWFGASVSIAQEHINWRFEQVPKAVFADTDQTWTVGVGGVPAGGLLTWSVAMNERVLARGEAELIPAAERAKNAGERQATIEWHTPALKPGVVMLARWALAVHVDRRQIAETSFDAWLFPVDPFALRRDWLKSLDLHLLTTDSVVVRRLETAQIPFRRVNGRSGLERLPNGVLVVAGVDSADQRRSLGVAIEAFVRRGGRCLWIAPPADTTVLDATIASDVAWRRWDVRREDVVNAFDKRLDERFWTRTEARVVPMHLTARRGEGSSSQMVWHTGVQNAGWPWLSGTTESGGQLVVCGFPLLSVWDQEPTPRYLFTQILASFASPSVAP